MTKAELVTHLAETAEVSKRQASDMLDALRDSAAEALRQDGEFTVPGILKLVVATRKARQGRNVQTGATIQIPERQVVRGKISKPFQTDVTGH